MFRATVIVLVIPAFAAAQVVPATHLRSGVVATIASAGLERDGRRPYRPQFEAAGMPAWPALDYFPNLRLPGQTELPKQPNPAIQIVKPPMRLIERDLGLADVQDVIFFSEKRLVRFRIHVKAAGESLAQRWSKALRRYFDFLDRDGDGELNRYEAEFAFSTAGIVRMLQTGFAYQRPEDAAAQFAEMDVNRDGRIQFAELAAYYAPAAGRMISAQANPIRDPYAETMTDELFKLLDTDHDGRLSRHELNAIENFFATLDADEDECLSALEIVPNLLNPPNPLNRAPSREWRSTRIRRQCWPFAQAAFRLR